MINQITISIIIPTHNRRNLLEETINSVKNQSYSNWELIVIDDCSTDHTWEYLSSINHKNIHVLKMADNVERSKARNIGLAKSNGEYVLFLDDDDLLTENALQFLFDSIITYPKAIACIGSYMTFDENGATDNYRIINKITYLNIFDDLLLGWMATAGHTLFQSQAIRSIGGWNEGSSFAEDHELWLKLAQNKNVVLIPEIVLEYRVHGQWRPENQNQIMDDLRVDAVKGLSGYKKRMGEGVLKARAILPVAEGLYEQEHYFKAFIQYFRISYLAPSLLFSPLSRNRILIPLLKCLLTRYGLKIGKFFMMIIKNTKK